MPQARKVPIEKAPPLAPRMDVPADAIENHGPLGCRIELGTPEIRAPRYACVLPDPEHFVDGIQRVDLEFVVSILAGDEYFHVVVLVDARIAFRQVSAHVGLLDGEAEVEAVVVPQHGHAGIEPGRRAGDDIDKGFRSRSYAPGWLIELAIDLDRPGRPVAGVMRQFF